MYKSWLNRTWRTAGAKGALRIRTDSNWGQQQPPLRPENKEKKVGVSRMQKHRGRGQGPVPAHSESGKSWKLEPTSAARMKNKLLIRTGCQKFPLWHSGLRIWHCPSCGMGCSCSSDPIPGPGTSFHMPQVQSEKKKNKKKNHKKQKQQPNKDPKQEVKGKSKPLLLTSRHMVSKAIAPAPHSTIVKG